MSFKVSFTSVARGGGVIVGVVATASVTTPKGAFAITLLLTNRTGPRRRLVWTGSFLSFFYSHTLSRRDMFSIFCTLHLSFSLQRELQNKQKFLPRISLQHRVTT